MVISAETISPRDTLICSRHTQAKGTTKNVLSDVLGLFDLPDLISDPVQHDELLVIEQHIVIICRTADDAGFASTNERQELTKMCTVRLSSACASARCR